MAGTHGRSAWTAEVRARELHRFDVKPVKAERGWKQDRPTWFTPRDAGTVAFWFHAKAAGPAALKLEDGKGALLREWRLEARPGLNRVDWDLQVDRGTIKDLPPGRRPFVRPGELKATLSAGGKSVEGKVKVEAPKEGEEPGG